MILKAHVEGGKIVTDEPVSLAEGTRLQISVIPTLEELKESRERLLKYAGIDTESAPDGSTTYERELYGEGR